VEDERGLDAHLRVMRENATYGGHMELSAFAHMTKRNVKVIQPGLVYVIEWNAGGWEEGSSVPSEPSTSDKTDPSMTPRRSRRTSSKAGSPSKNKWKAEEEKKMKLGKGYYVYEEITSEEDSVKVKTEEMEKVTLENAGPTVYVA
jgi:OTU domain-containing protein 3